MTACVPTQRDLRACPDSGAQQIRAACAFAQIRACPTWARRDRACRRAGAGPAIAMATTGWRRAEPRRCWWRPGLARARARSGAARVGVACGRADGPGSKVRSNSQFHPWLSVNAAVSRVSISISAAMIRSRADRPYRSPLPAKSLHARAAPRHATALTRRPRRAQLRAPVLAISASLVKAAPTPAFALARVFAARALAWLPLSDTSSAEREHRRRGRGRFDLVAAARTGNRRDAGCLDHLPSRVAPSRSARTPGSRHASRSGTPAAPFPRKERHAHQASY